MSGLYPETARPAHPYTRSECPWILESGSSRDARLVRYISAGGTRTFGRTVKQEEARRRQRRFCIEAAALAVVWLLLLVF